MRRPLTLLIFSAEGIPGHWDAVCLDFNIWSSGDSIKEASEMLEGAILFALEDCEPAAFETADPALFAVAHEIIELTLQGEGLRADVDKMDENAGEIQRGVLMRTFLCKGQDGEWCIGAPTTPTPLDSIPKAA